ncbi:hypothetical protein C1H46_000029 [Malus baccata]|uniref:non-specific serine/threonine protein kinase n=1 Tax=Malus baccata TaxID=106549 RepID=A0A540NUB1_MALBA|nr:hypothetical protein C1H46_000029 [Malus baccata]
MLVKEQKPGGGFALRGMGSVGVRKEDMRVIGSHLSDNVDRIEWLLVLFRAVDPYRKMNQFVWKGNTSRPVINIVVPIVVCLALIIFIFICLRVRRTKKKPETSKLLPGGGDTDESRSAESLQFDFGTIRVATEDFSEENKLGQGRFGNEGLLVYEFVPNPSLDHIIFDPTKCAQLDLDRRYKIIVGTARGILYLHEDSRLRIIHHDLKASNILINAEMYPKISGFSMASWYMVSEYEMRAHFSVKSYVYSFSMLVLETISGQKNSSFCHGDNVEDLIRHGGVEKGQIDSNRSDTEDWFEK